MRGKERPKIKRFVYRCFPRGRDKFPPVLVFLTAERLRDFDVHVYTEDPETNPTATGTLCWHYDGQAGDGETEELVCCDGPIRGRFVRMTNAPGFSLTLCEVQVMAVPAV